MRISRPLPIGIGLSLVLVTGVADAMSTTCTTSTVCAQFINSSSGVAIHGEANTGIGLRGTSNGSTGSYGATRSGDPFLPGIEGESLDPGDDDAAAAFGIAGQMGPINGQAIPPPAFGSISFGSTVGAEAITENAGNTNGGSVSAAGVYGEDLGGASGDDANAGVAGYSFFGTAVVGTASVTGIDASGYGTFPTGVIGDAEPDHQGGSAVGVAGISEYAPFEAFNPSTSTGVLAAVSAAFGNYALLVLTGATTAKAAFSVDDSGNINAASLTTMNGTYARTTGTSGTARTLYAPHATSPVTEDFGEAQLVNGRGYVRLDPALADVIDNRNAYHVFLTPEGDSNGLYVTQKSPAGFTVREAHGGRSTMAFEYRILAKPVDENGVRLAVAPPLPHVAPLLQNLRPRNRNAPAPKPLDAFARLKMRLGPAGYARALAAARQNQIGR